MTEDEIQKKAEIIEDQLFSSMLPLVKLKRPIPWDRSVVLDILENNIRSL